MKKRTYWLMAIMVSGFGLMQLISPEKIPNSLTSDLSSVPKDVNNIIRQSCFDCHSSTTNLSWFDELTPVNFIVHDHIEKGRKALNFSNFDSLSKAKQNATLYYALNKVLSGEMPLPAYALFHPKAKISKEEIKRLKQYISSQTPRKVAVDLQFEESIIIAQKPQKQVIKENITPSPNGIEYIKHWKDWKAISTTDRFDNGTMRIIYGNDIAVKAIQAKEINPYPDGAIIAKAAWQEQMNKDGNIVPGKFIQVEFMIKNAKKYISTAGWGWARWKGNDLKPYGNNITFTTECVSCHNPVKNNDYVFTTPLNLENFIHTK